MMEFNWNLKEKRAWAPPERLVVSPALESELMLMLEDFFQRQIARFMLGGELEAKILDMITRLDYLDGQLAIVLNFLALDEMKSEP